MSLAVKDLGSCDLYPQSLVHNPNGRFVTVCGDGEYIIYTALAWRNKSFGSALEFAWGEDSNIYATRCFRQDSCHAVWIHHRTSTSLKHVQAPRTLIFKMGRVKLIKYPSKCDFCTTAACMRGYSKS